MQYRLIAGLALVSIFCGGGLLLGDEPDVRQLIQESIVAGKTEINLPAGVFYLSDPIVLENARHVSIRGHNTTLVMTRPSELFTFRNCEDLSVSGLVLDYDPLPFTQGTITSVSTDQRIFTFAIHDGYPPLREGKTDLVRHFFDRDTRLWKSGSNWFQKPRIEIIGEKEGRAVFMAAQPGVKTGDLIALDNRFFENFACVSISGCGRMEFRDVTVLAAPGIAFVGRNCYAETVFLRVKIERGPKPSGASQGRLLSTNADGVNYANCRKGPILRECDFSFMGDDSLNVHGLLLPVVRVKSPNEIWVLRPKVPEAFPSVFREGDVVEFLASGNFAKTGTTAAFKSIEPLPSPKEVTPAEVAVFFPEYKDFSKPYTVYQLNLKGLTGSVEKGQWLQIPAINCPEYEVHDSYFHDHRARGLRVMGSNGLIEGNRFARIGTAAIQIGPEIQYWREAGWVSNVTVLKNDIRDIGFSGEMTAPWCYSPGAISICARTDEGKPPYWRGNRRITIENNVISNCPVSGIHAYAATELVIRHNLLKNVNTANTATVTNHIAGQKYFLLSSDAIELDGVSNSLIEDNEVIIDPPASEKKSSQESLSVQP